MGTKRRRMVVALDSETIDRWRAVASHHGVTLSALLEAMGRLIEPAGPGWPLLTQAVTDARAIMVERNDRRQDGGPAQLL